MLVCSLGNSTAPADELGGAFHLAIPDPCGIFLGHPHAPPVSSAHPRSASVGNDALGLTQGLLCFVAEPLFVHLITTGLW